MSAISAQLCRRHDASTFSNDKARFMLLFRQVLKTASGHATTISRRRPLNPQIWRAGVAHTAPYGSGVVMLPAVHLPRNVSTSLITVVPSGSERTSRPRRGAARKSIGAPFSSIPLRTVHLAHGGDDHVLVLVGVDTSHLKRTTANHAECRVAGTAPRQNTTWRGIGKEVSARIDVFLPSAASTHLYQQAGNAGFGERSRGFSPAFPYLIKIGGGHLHFQSLGIRLCGRFHVFRLCALPQNCSNNNTHAPLLFMAHLLVKRIPMVRSIRDVRKPSRSRR